MPLAKSDYITINIERALHKRIKVGAEIEGIPINEFLKRVLDDKLINLDSLRIRQ